MVNIGKLYPYSARAQWLVLTAIATYLSLASNPGDVFISVWDKFLHVLCWFVLTLSLRIAWLHWPWFLVGAFALFIYASVVELLQGLNPARDPSFADIIANGLGVVLGYLFAKLLEPLHKRFLALPFFNS